MRQIGHDDAGHYSPNSPGAILGRIFGRLAYVIIITWKIVAWLAFALAALFLWGHFSSHGQPMDQGKHLLSAVFFLVVFIAMRVILRVVRFILTGR